MVRNVNVRLNLIRGVLLLPALGALGWGFAHRESISAVAPPAPTAAESAGGVAVYFSRPQLFDGEYTGGPDGVLAAAIDGARSRVDIASYDFDLLSVARALLRAAGRGVTVRMVVDSDNWKTEALDWLRAEGIPVVGDAREGLMHDKFVVIDGAEVWAGSMNLTVNDAYRNDNNLLRIRSAELADIFTAEFEEMFAAKHFGPASPAGRRAPPAATEAGPVEALFAPEDAVGERITGLIGGARRSIRFLAFSFTSDPISAAMTARAAAGVTLAGVMESSQVRSNIGTQFDALRTGGGRVYLDANPRNMHHKVILIDDDTVIVGSYNFTASADANNDEDLLIIRNRALAAAFAVEFRRVLDQAQAAAEDL
jgi:phosphatidylserine/phosphatidylglycerophosphate/cardiolipin synthase-like enzyme